MSGPGGQEGSLWFTTDVETGLFELMARAEAEVLPEGRVVRIDSRDGDQSSTITLASIEPGPLPWDTFEAPASYQQMQMPVSRLSRAHGSSETALSSRPARRGVGRHPLPHVTAHPNSPANATAEGGPRSQRSEPSEAVAWCLDEQPRRGLRPSGSRGETEADGDPQQQREQRASVRSTSPTRAAIRLQ